MAKKVRPRGRPRSGKERTHIMLSPPVLQGLKTAAKAAKRGISSQAEIYIERGLEAEKAA